MLSFRRRLLLTIGIPTALAASFLVVDAFLHSLSREPWPDSEHLIMAGLLLVASSAMLTLHQHTLAQRAQARTILASREAGYRSLFDQFPEPVTVWSGDGVLLMQNLVSARNLGGSRDDYLGKPIREVLGPDAGPGYLERLQRVYRTGVTEEQEDVVGLPIGHRYFWTTMQRVAQLDGGNAVQVISYDITERLQAEQAWRESEDLRIRERSGLEERQKLARELHDSVSQALYGIALGVNTALTVLDRDREAAREALNYSISLARAGLSEMRALIFELRPESLESEGLVPALLKTADAMHARFELPVNVEVCEEPDLPFASKEMVYRIAQEALHNAIKHAQSSELTLRLACDDGCLTLTVVDDGIGFDPVGPYPGHLGLKSMRERAASVGGRLQIVSGPRTGTLVQLQVPLESGQE